MSSNTILKSGSIGNEKKSDSKFLTLSRIIDTKLDKNISGDIYMNGYKISNAKLPIFKDDVATKQYVDNITNIIQDEMDLLPTKDYVDSVTQSLPTNSTLLDKINLLPTKDYVNSITKPVYDEIDLYLLITTAEQISIILKKYNQINNFNLLVSGRNNFLISLKFSISMFNVYKTLKLDVKYFNEFSNCTMFMDLKHNVVKIIENLPKDMFYELKNELKIDPVEKRSTRKLFRRILNESINLKFPDSVITEKLQLLIDKNYLLLDLGFIYFIDSLLDYLLEPEPVE